MKKRILSLILVLMLLPFASIFSACGKKGYDLTTLDDEFFAIEKENSNIELSGGVLSVTYSNCSVEFRNAVSNTAPYKELKKYNQVFYNLMSFSSLYIDECSNSSVKIGKNEGKRLHEEVESFKSSVNELNECTNMLAEIIGMSSGTDIVDKVCLVRYENLLKSYEDVFERGSILHNSISNLYYNKILQNGNPNISEISESDFDATVVANNFQSRLIWQKSNLSQVLAEMYVCGGTLAEEIAKNNGTTFDLTKLSYQVNIDALYNTKDAETIAYLINNLKSTSTEKKQFYQLSVMAYNAQEVIDADGEKFNKASSAVKYTSASANLDVSAYEYMCYCIIEDYHLIIDEYNGILQGMVNIINA